VFLYGTLAAILYISKVLFMKERIKVGNISMFLMYTLSLIMQFWMVFYSVQEIMQV